MYCANKNAEITISNKSDLLANALSGERGWPGTNFQAFFFLLKSGPDSINDNTEYSAAPPHKFPSMQLLDSSSVSQCQSSLLCYFNVAQS